MGRLQRLQLVGQVILVGPPATVDFQAAALAIHAVHFKGGNTRMVHLLHEIDSQDAVCHLDVVEGLGERFVPARAGEDIELVNDWLVLNLDAKDAFARGMMNRFGEPEHHGVSAVGHGQAVALRVAALDLIERVVVGLCNRRCGSDSPAADRLDRGPSHIQPLADPRRHRQRDLRPDTRLDAQPAGMLERRTQLVREPVEQFIAFCRRGGLGAGAGLDVLARDVLLEQLRSAEAVITRHFRLIPPCPVHVAEVPGRVAERHPAFPADVFGQSDPHHRLGAPATTLGIGVKPDEVHPQLG